LDHLRCVVERITYQNEENGYSVIKCRVKNYSDLVTVVGSMAEVHVGSVLTMEGFWKVDPKYGRQFSMQSYEETLPATVFGIEKYLGSGLIKGVGPKFAKRIVQKFGAETLNVIEETPDLLIEVEGIGKLRVERIKKGWTEQKEIKNIMLFLQSHEVSTSHATKIYKTYGNDSIKIVQENPYKLADDIWGIGFKTADTIAEKMGFGHERYTRLRSGIMYTLNRLSEDGHCYATREQLMQKGTELLEVEEHLLIMTLDEMIKQKDVIVEKIKPETEMPFEYDTSTEILGAAESLNHSGTIMMAAEASSPYGKVLSGQAKDSTSDYGEATEAIYLPPFFFSETGTARRLKKILSSPRNMKIGGNDLIDRIQKRAHISYDSIQQQAILAAVANKILILTGGPGTGKTTTTLGIITAFREAGAKIILAAPTGRAAKRLSETTHMEAKTIHRLLEVKPPEGYQKNEDNPLQGDVLIVDECSMIDIMLMYNLLKAVPDEMTVIFVGDVDQLPSVGAGNVLSDMIHSGRIPVVKLERIFRQAQGSRIIMNAHRINRGEAIDMRGGKESDFFFAAQETPEAAADLIVKYVTENLPRYYKADRIRDIQVLTPMQRGVVGAVNLNQRLQDALNKTDILLRRSGTEYRLHDKVMQIRNDYDKEVYNGDIGFISSVDMEERELTVNFEGREVKYDVTELDELVLAYACTIHKSQGSEYPIVVMPFMMTHYIMLQRNLLYTGVTRAKKILILVGEKKAVSMAIRNNKAVERNTRLCERLKG